MVMELAEPKIDVEACHVVSATWADEKWMRVPVKPLQEALQLGKTALLVDVTARRQELLPPFILDEYVRDTAPEYPYMMIAGDQEADWQLSEYQRNLLLRFHDTWYNALGSYLYSLEFKTILTWVKQARETEQVFPESEQLFSAFLLPLGSVRCVWMGLAPYASKQANGTCFGVDEGGMTPSLLVLEQAIRDSANLGFTWTLEKNLRSLSHQGVLMLNARLTATRSCPEGHPIWSLFLRKVIALLAQKPVLHWVLFGKVAQACLPLIPSHHVVYPEYHPAWYARQEKLLHTQTFARLQTALSLTY